MADRVALPCGSWPTPITATVVVEAAVRLGNLRADGQELWWLELRPEEGGRTALVKRRADGTLTDLLPDPWNVRTAVHEYGGGALWVRDGTAWFTNWADQRLYRLGPGGEPEPITPDPAVPRGLRYADGDVSPDGTTMLCVRERHERDGTVINEIVQLSVAGGDGHVVVSGSDFVSNPRWDATGDAYCWIEWDHPSMPWDATRLVARIGGEDVLVAGGPVESVLQPVWEPGGSLLFLSDRSGWWNLYRWWPETNFIEPVVAMEAEIGEPQWVFGRPRFGLAASDAIAFTYWRDGVDHLAVAESTGVIRDIALPYNEYSDVAIIGDTVNVIAASAIAEAAVVAIGPVGARTPTVEVVRPPRHLPLDPTFLPPPDSLDFPTTGGRTAHALFYPPASPTHEAPTGERPPVITMIHGGPTAAARPSLDLGVRFWTSRGFAVVDVNYGGSTGYGRAYRDQLKGNWGVVDVDDAVAAVRSLAANGQVDPARLCIEGGSAGGFTVLACLAFRDTFNAGADQYGVADLEALARDTHKFESRYLDGLVGPYPQRKDVYVARSPIHHIDGFDRPLIVLQGLEDMIVPPNQSEMIVDALRAKGVPVAYLTFEGEQHGFRQAANIVRALNAQLSFFAQLFGFVPPPAEGIEAIAVDNLAP
jgi:dipeptidyl aminopeptidase/acylaminoacyl peptidase